MFRHFTKRGAGKMTHTQIHGSVSGKWGIIYFEDCFSSSDPNVGGDHIDLWDGKLMMNDRLNYNGPGERGEDDVARPDRFFKDAKRNIWFLALT